MKILIAGPPAAGKGTQCEIIKKKYGVIHLSTGDMLRSAVKNGTELGKKAKDFMDNGELVPDKLVLGIIEDRMKQKDCEEKGWLLDGFPRTGPQAEFLKKMKLIPDVCLLLEVPDEVLVDRISGRRTDPVTGNIYHVTFNPPPSEEVLKRCKQRSDDTEEKIKVRLGSYHKNVSSVVGHFKDIVEKVDGNQKKETVTKEVLESLKKYEK